MVSALPANIPSHITLDITNLKVGDSLRVSDLPAIEGVAYVSEPEHLLVMVAMPAAVVAEVPAEAPAEGEEAAAAATAEGEEEA
jgi:large subunit ribosomal protein L25